jgi:hypothetical protein
MAAIVVSAWLFGGTRDWTVEVIRWLLLAMTALFVIGLLLRRRWPRVPWLVAVPSLFLLLLGWFMTANASRRFIPEVQLFVDAAQRFPGWPGFWDATLTLQPLLLMTGLLGALWVTCDLAANRQWRNLVWLTIAATGLSMMLLGLAQRFTDAPGIFWDPYRYVGETFFATFRYHANAGAYINLVLPFIVALAVRAFYREGAEKSRVFWTLSSFVTAACGFINVSRAANLVCALLLFGMAAWITAARLRTLRTRRILASVSIVLGLLAAAALMALSFGIDRAVGRWESNGFWDQERALNYELLVEEFIPATGWWGYGPGTFEPIFNPKRSTMGRQPQGIWAQAHSDILQTPVDYGWAGAAAWTILLGGALVSAALGARRRGRKPDETEILSMACAFALAGVSLHAFVDFPLQISSLQLYAMVIAGLAWGGAAPAERKDRKRQATAESARRPRTARPQANDADERQDKARPR